MRSSRLLAVVAVALLLPSGTAAAPDATAASTCADPAAQGCVRTSTVRVGPETATATTVRAIQFNLCDSGIAPCYTHDRSPGEAAAVIDRYAPTVVTLNEICSRNVLDATAPIPAAMARVAAAAGDSTVVAAFTPAVNSIAHAPYRCVNGDEYGIGLVVRGPGPATARARYLYRVQFARTGEHRVAACLAVGGTDFCTTHLESDDRAVAAGQCRELMDTDVPAFRTATRPPTVVGGDLNLLTACTPPGWGARGDRGVQHVLWAGGFRLAFTRTIAMHDTDHPALLVDLTRT
ncbi:MAG TPA: hypothetical protein VHV49_04945 [Pseudonocardiaceae bacterium]|nr:hypothetical protein [Pseudonocardiaceae bacterium]